ncbi:MAG: polymer-forming cytoskeletal protein [Helicobacteraceae bacterium]|nr:polymer-forming cytoskeletal protein [Helicobacteraceae bacterium]
MAIFSNGDDAKVAGADTTTIITEGSSIQGEMQLTCDLYVDGKFDGKIDSQKSITVGKNGFIQGEINTKHLIVQGEVKGTVDADRIEIKESGKISGTMSSSELIIEAQGIFEGESKIKTTSSSAAHTFLSEESKLEEVLES